MRHALYAAMLPVMPRTIFLPFNILIDFVFEYTATHYSDIIYLSQVMEWLYLLLNSLRRIRVNTCLVLYVKSLLNIQL